MYIDIAFLTVGEESKCGDAIIIRFGDLFHHGSRHNVGPRVLERFFGHKGVEGRRDAVRSAAAEGGPRYPTKMVTNAFRRRDYPVHVTRGGAKSYRDNSSIPIRDAECRGPVVQRGRYLR